MLSTYRMFQRRDDQGFYEKFKISEERNIVVCFDYSSDLLSKKLIVREIFWIVLDFNIIYTRG